MFHGTTSFARHFDTVQNVCNLQIVLIFQAWRGSKASTMTPKSLFLLIHAASFTPPKAPSFVSELRFRCANSLQDFPNGKDLLSTNKSNPWSISLSALANQTTYLNFREQLILGNLASQTMLDTWVTTKGHTISDRNVLSYITFASPFSSVSTIVTLRSTRQQKIRLVFCRARNPCGSYGASVRDLPYGGKLSSQF